MIFNYKQKICSDSVTYTYSFQPRIFNNNIRDKRRFYTKYATLVVRLRVFRRKHYGELNKRMSAVIRGVFDTQEVPYR